MSHQRQIAQGDQGTVGAAYPGVSDDHRQGGDEERRADAHKHGIAKTLEDPAPAGVRQLPKSPCAQSADREHKPEKHRNRREDQGLHAP
jgi:hypothetical protein